MLFLIFLYQVLTSFCCFFIPRVYYKKISQLALQTQYLLEMPHLIGAVYEMSSFTKKGVHPSGNHNSFNLTMLASRPREDFITWFLCNWQRLTSESRLINFKRVTLQQTSICWYNVPQLYADYISRNQDSSLMLDPPPISQNL